jgi:hypothetical protein
MLAMVDVIALFLLCSWTPFVRWHVRELICSGAAWWKIREFLLFDICIMAMPIAAWALYRWVYGEPKPPPEGYSRW